MTEKETETDIIKKWKWKESGAIGTMQSGGEGYVWHMHDHEKMMMKKEEKERENKTPRLLILLRKPNKSVQQRPFASLVKSAGGIQ